MYTILYIKRLIYKNESQLIICMLTNEPYEVVQPDFMNLLDQTPLKILSGSCFFSVISNN